MIMDLFEAAKDGKQKLKCDLVDGKICVPVIIGDFRGKSWNEVDDNGAWIKHTIEKLGEVKPDHGVFDADLTETQQSDIQTQNETERIAGLDTDQRDTEKQAALNSALSQAGQLKNEREIIGDTDALAVSQAWYAEQKTIIETKYA